jgi:hemoglobin
MQTAQMIPPRFALTRVQIETVVAKFYAQIRKHPKLGPIFNTTISTDKELWRIHEAKIAGFWANAILHERSYDGNPMLVHAGISAIEPEMFNDWLALFDQTLTKELPSDVAAQWSALAHRIGRGLRMGVEFNRSNAKGPPILR